MATRPYTVELKPQEVVRVAKQIFQKGDRTFNYDTALQFVEQWYENIEPKIDLGSKIDLAYMIMYISFEPMPINEETVKTNIFSGKTIDKKALTRLVNCLTNAQKIHSKYSQ